LCIEPPLSLSDADSIRNEKVKVLSAIRRFREDEVTLNSVRAQYVRGAVHGEDVRGYLEEEGVAANSHTETYAALKLEIDNWRWAGVPIYLRAGKRLPKRVTEIAITFKRPPGSLFKGRQVGELEQNVLSIQVQPNEGMQLKISSKPPGPRLRVRPVVMDFAYTDSFGIASPDAYERLLLDAMKGDATLFTRDDEIEQAWDLLAPVLNVWGEPAKISGSGLVSGAPVYTYEAGAWGPQAAAGLLKPLHHRWRRL
jgi:glucose-6-phosphate 1-dehydrogenase